MTDTEQLVAFLRARLDEDERLAQHRSYPVSAGADGDFSNTAYLSAARATEEWQQSWHTHACGWSVGESLVSQCTCVIPARVLAGVAAKRALLDKLLHYRSEDAAPQRRDLSRTHDLLCLLASEWSGHPDWHAAWLR